MKVEISRRSFRRSVEMTKRKHHVISKKLATEKSLIIVSLL